MDIRVEKIDAHYAQETANNMSTFSARRIVIDGNVLFAIVHSNGPTNHVSTVLDAIDLLPLIRKVR